MFQPFKRAAFISKHAGPYLRAFGGEIAKDHMFLQNTGWPANEFVDWFMRAKGNEHEFVMFFQNMYAGVRFGDLGSLERLLRQVTEERFRRTDQIGLIRFLQQAIEGARSNERD